MIHIVCQIFRDGRYTLTDESRLSGTFEAGSCIEMVDGESRLNPNMAWHAMLKAFQEKKRDDRKGIEAVVEHPVAH